jgi:hypothetical protein
VCVEPLAKIALPVSPSNVVIMRVMLDRGDLEIKLGSETLGAGLGGPHLLFFTFTKFYL